MYDQDEKHLEPLAIGEGTDTRVIDYTRNHITEQLRHIGVTPRRYVDQTPESYTEHAKLCARLVKDVIAILYSHGSDDLVQIFMGILAMEQGTNADEIIAARKSLLIGIREIVMQMRENQQWRNEGKDPQVAFADQINERMRQIDREFGNGPKAKREADVPAEDDDFMM